MKLKWTRVMICRAIAVSLLLTPLPAAVHSASSVSAAAYSTAGAVASAATAVKNMQILVDGEKLALSAPVYKVEGVAMAPMKDLFAALGVTATLEKSTQTIIARQGATTLSMKIGKKEAIVNGNTVKLDAAAAIRNDIPYVPVRFVAERFDATVGWDGKEQAIRITTWEAAELAEYADWEDERNNKATYTSSEIVDMYDESVVMIVTNRGQGSGIVVGENLILTNYHMAEDVSSAAAYSIYGDEVKVTGVVRTDEKADLAIMKTEEPLDLAVVEVGYGFDTRKGDKVIAIGSPLGLQNTVSDGLISNYTYEDRVNYLQISAPIDSGSSGGALFSEYGELIGITTSGYPNTNADLNFAVSVFHAAILMNDITDKMIQDAKFLTPKLPDTLVGAPLSDIQKLMKDQFSSVQTTEGKASFSKWEVVRDPAGWLVLTANIDPQFYLYYGHATADELRYWSINLGHELHRMLPDERIQLVISFERDYGFQPRGFASGEVTSLGDGKWRIHYSVIDMQLKDQLYIEVRS